MATLVALFCLAQCATVNGQYIFNNFAGMPGVSGTNDGVGSVARFNTPVGPALDISTNVYVADALNHTIRKITRYGVVTTLAGMAGVSGTNDGTGSAARFNQPQAVAVDTNGNVFVADWGSHTIRKVTQAGVVTTLAGSAGNPGCVDATGSNARFSAPEGIAVDGNGNLFVADRDNFVIRKVTPAGVVSTLAGSPGARGFADGTGSAALFDDPSAVAVDGGGNLFVGDRGNNAIRKVTPEGMVTTLAGSTISGWADGTGSAARFDRPSGLAVDDQGNVFVTDEGNHAIRKVTTLGVVTTIGGTPGVTGTNSGVGPDALFYLPVGVAVDPTGMLVVADAGNHCLTVGASLVPQPRDYFYTKNNGTITIASYTGTDTAVIIPSAINGLPVKSIGDNAFYNHSALTSVTIPDGVTNIGNWAFFNCTSLTHLTMGNNVNNIQDNAFYNCTGLISIAIPNSVTNIGSWAFYNCRSLTTATIGNSVRNIGSNAFSFCTDLSSAILPDSVIRIGDHAYFSCESMTNLWLGNSVTSIEDDAFYGCTYVPAATIPNSVTNIGSAAFDYCTSLTGVTIPNGIPSIKDYTFFNCTALTNIMIGSSVRSVGNHALLNCASLTNITVDPLNIFLAGVDGVLFDRDIRTLIQFPGGRSGSYTIPNSVTNIADAAFSNCRNLTRVDTGNNVLNIGNQTFTDCISLSTVTIPDSVVAIGNSAFEDCVSLSSITIPNGVTNIGYGAFYNCASLTNALIGRGVLSIGRDAFPGCRSLGAIDVDVLNPVYASVGGVLFDKNIQTLLFCPEGRSGSYTIPNSTTNIVEYAFSNCASLTNVTIGNSVRSIGTRAFDYCARLTSVTIPNSVISIGEYAFFNCTSLNSITIPDSVTTIGISALSSCTNLATVTMGNGVSSILSHVFNYCTRLTSVTIPNSVTNIEWAAFASCTGLTNVTIGNHMVNIGDYAFAACTDLATITIPRSVTSIESWAFAYCTRLTSVYFEGNAPEPEPVGLFVNDPDLTVYYRAGTTGWRATYADKPTALWTPSYLEWARIVGLSDLFPADSAEDDDPDHDGMSNQAEMQAGTDPTDPGSKLVFESEPRTNDLVDADKTAIGSDVKALYFQTVPGKKYGIQSTVDFGGAWQAETNVTATTTQKRVLFKTPVARIFFRLVLIP
jgi:sugar lactone lactonase YvrE